MKLQAIDNWHKTITGRIVFTVVELAASYGFASLAIDCGNLWWYLLAIVFFVGSAQNFIKLIILISRRSRKRYG